jgi:PAS domain S-box-containing protein
MNGMPQGLSAENPLSSRVVRELLDATTDILGIATPDLRVSYFNPQGLAFFGLSVEDAAKHTVSELHPPAAFRHLQETAFPQATEEGRWAGETEVQSPTTGEVSSVSIVIVCHRDDEDEVVAYSALMRPTTSSERQEAVFRLQRVALVELATHPALGTGALDEVLQPILRAAAACLEVERVGAWFFSEESEVLTCQLLYERSPDSFSAGAVLKRSDYPTYFSALLTERTIPAGDARNDPLTVEFRESYLPAHDIHALLDAPIRLRGSLIGVVCHEHCGQPRVWSPDEQAFAGTIGDFIALAVSAKEDRDADARRRELEATVLRSQRLEALGVLAGGVAHDFNNLLQGMIGHVELALRTLDSRPEITREALEDAREVTRQGSELSRQLLAYANHRRQRSSSSAKFVIEKLRPILEVPCKGRAHLELDLDPSCPEAAIGPTQLQQIVLNLVTNAAEASAQPSDEIRIKAELVERSQAELAAYERSAGTRAGTFVALSVSDQGQGMKPEVRDQIFAPFFSTRGEDRGLGLPSVLGILRSVGGAILLESEPGRGSRLEVLLPLAHSESELVKEPPRPEPVQLARRGQVLVVEDQVTVRRAAQQVLGYIGLSSVAAGDGESAIAIYEADPSSISCLLLDNGLPRMSGIEVLERLRRQDPEVQAVLVTGYGDLDVEAAAQRLEAPLLHKPYSIDDLVAALGSVIPARKEC